MSLFQKLMLAAVIAWSVSTAAMAGAFGINQGMTAKDLKILKTLKRTGTTTVYDVQPAIPNPSFQEYFVVVDDVTGVCGMLASSAENMDDADGQDVIASYYAVATSLAQKYGKGQPLTSDQKGSRPGQKDFANQLYTGEKKVAAFWRFEPDSPGDLSQIMLAAHSDSPTSTKLLISYRFKNAKGCMPS